MVIWGTRLIILHIYVHIYTFIYIYIHADISLREHCHIYHRYDIFIKHRMQNVVCFQGHNVL